MFNNTCNCCGCWNQCRLTWSLVSALNFQFNFEITRKYWIQSNKIDYLHSNGNNCESWSIIKYMQKSTFVKLNQASYTIVLDGSITANDESYLIHRGDPWPVWDCLCFLKSLLSSLPNLCDLAKLLGSLVKARVINTSLRLVIRYITNDFIHLCVISSLPTPCFLHA